MRRYLFLYLAIACFLGIIAIFVFQGYMGVYDTIRITSGENEQTITPDVWYRNYYPGYNPSAGGIWPGKIFFSYQVDNRQFSSYSTAIQASVWQENQKIMDLFSRSLTIKPFDKATVEWTVDGQQLESRGFSAGQYTVKIERDGVERRIVVYYNTLLSPKGPVPAPSR